jgi:hypothetical protein
MAYHRVRGGDTWSSIAKQYGLNETDLMGYNNATAVPPEGTRLALPTYGTSAPWQRGIGLHKSPNPEYIAPVLAPSSPPQSFGQNLWGLLTGGPSDWTKLQGGSGVTGVRGYNPTGPKPGNASPYLNPAQRAALGGIQTSGALAENASNNYGMGPSTNQYGGVGNYPYGPPGMAENAMPIAQQGAPTYQRPTTGGVSANYQPPATRGVAGSPYANLKADMMNQKWDTPVTPAAVSAMGFTPQMMQQAGYIQDQNGTWQPPGAQPPAGGQTYQVGRGGHATYYNEQQYLNFLRRKKNINRSRTATPADNAGNTPLSVLAQHIGSG